MVCVSVIIPVYNVEDYLEECLDSIVNQTLDDIEIICINDGSTDGSLNILNNYKNEDSRIIVYSEKNKGQGAARNYGLDLAKGKYIYFMDADDVLNTTALEKLYNFAEEKNLDFALFQAISYYMDKDEYVKEENYSMNDLADYVGDKVFNYKDIKDYIFDVTVSPCFKLYNREFIRKSGAKFPEGLVFEDNVFFYEILFSAERIAFYREYLYKRRWYSSSTTTSGNKNSVDTIEINNLIIKTFIKYGVFGEFKKTLFNRKIDLIYMRFNRVKDEFKDYFYDKMRREFQSMINDPLYENLLNILYFNNRVIFFNVLLFEKVNDFILNENIDISLDFYNMARIDLKNTGSENNNLEIIEYSDNDLSVTSPSWFNDSEGIGYVIESNDKNFLDIKFKCVNDGELNVFLRSKDLRDIEGNRFPIYINYRNLLINGKNLIDDTLLVSHDEPYTYSRKVEDGELIDLHLEWMPLNEKTRYIDYKKILRNENNDLKKNFSDLNEKFSSLKDNYESLDDKFNLLNSKFSSLNKNYQSLSRDYNSIINSSSWKITKPLRKLKLLLKK